MLPRITESPVDPEIMRLIRNCAAAAAKILKLDPSRQSGSAAIHAVDECIFQLQRGGGPELDEDDEPDHLFGSLWGEQLVLNLGWQWGDVVFHDHDDSKAIGVFSPDRAMAIYPFHFIYGCLENDADVTIELAYNMLVDKSRIPPLPPRGYENVMDHVQHIVPRT